MTSLVNVIHLPVYKAANANGECYFGDHSCALAWAGKRGSVCTVNVAYAADDVPKNECHQRLIAAAPDLLAALQSLPCALTDAYELCGDSDCNRCRSIAKATTP